MAPAGPAALCVGQSRWLHQDLGSGLGVETYQLPRDRRLTCDELTCEVCFKKKGLDGTGKDTFR